MSSARSSQSGDIIDKPKKSKLFITLIMVGMVATGVFSTIIAKLMDQKVVTIS